MPGGSKLIEALVTSPICQGEGGNMAMIGANGGVEFGVDPDEDPELAMALRISLEEQRQRQNVEVGANNEAAVVQQDNAMDAQPAEQPVTGTAQSSTVKAPSANVDCSLMTEEEQLEWALRMSVADEAEPVESDAKTENSKL